MYLTCISVAALCYSSAASPAAAVLLLAGAVRHRVTGDTFSCCVSLGLIPVLISLHIKTRLIFMYHLAVLSHAQPGFTNETSSSVIEDMRGAKPGVSPQRRRTLVSICIAFT